MSKVAEEDERETCMFLPARGRFLLCNRGTQLGTMCWPRASSEPDSTTKTRECPLCIREKKEEEKRGKKERDGKKFRCGLFAQFDAIAILWHAWRMVQPARFMNSLNRFMFMLEKKLEC